MRLCISCRYDIASAECPYAGVDGFLHAERALLGIRPISEEPTNEAVLHAAISAHKIGGTLTKI